MVKTPDVFKRAVWMGQHLVDGVGEGGEERGELELGSHGSQPCRRPPCWSCLQEDSDREVSRASPDNASLQNIPQLTLVTDDLLSLALGASQIPPPDKRLEQVWDPLFPPGRGGQVGGNPWHGALCTAGC